MVAALSLDGWGDIAQFAIAIGGVGALIGVYLQLRLGHATSRRARVYDYADCFNKRDMLRASAEYVERLWGVSGSLVTEVRAKEGRPTFYSEWEEMQADTPGRSDRNLRDRRRRLAHRKYLRSLLDPPH